LTDIVVYWRPGCGFCSRLFRALDRRGVPHVRRDVWDDEAAAAEVRAAAGGNETVPTVKVGSEMLVNPTVPQILQAVHRLDPDSDLPEPPEPGRMARRLFRLLGGSRG
jgi:mycoredoxin